jgi:hypothetical protein
MRTIEISRPFLPPASEVYRLLGYPTAKAASGDAQRLVREGLNRAAVLIDAAACVLDVGVEAVTADAVKIFEGPEFRSQTLARILTGCPCAVLCLATIGEALEREATRLAESGDDAAAVILDAIGSTAVEVLQREVGKRLCTRYEPDGLHVTRHYSPGYTGWPLDDQRALFACWQATGAALPVRINESAMMIPRKSLSSIWGITDQPLDDERSADRIACGSCDMHECDFRRIPYAQPDCGLRIADGGKDERDLKDEDLSLAVSNPHSSIVNRQSPIPNPQFPRVRPIDYAITIKALGKWARQYLTCESDGDGVRHYRFRYMGNTCCDGGTPINSVMHAMIRPEPRGMVFERGWIEIEEDDPGLQAMCEFYGRRWAFHDELERPPAWSGQTLEEVLGETIAQAKINPAGCFCKPSQVNHKWRMVLSTIHYALSLETARAPSSI